MQSTPITCPSTTLLTQRKAPVGNVPNPSHSEITPAPKASSAISHSSDALKQKVAATNDNSKQKVTNSGVSSGSSPPSSGGGGVGVDISSSTTSSCALIGISSGKATVVSSRSAVSSPNSPTLSSSKSCSWFGPMVDMTVASWLNSSSAVSLSFSSSSLSSSLSLSLSLPPKTFETMLPAMSSSPNEVSSYAIAGGSAAPAAAGIIAHTRGSIIRVIGLIFEPIWERD